MVERHLSVLKLLLDQAGVGSDISTIDHRKSIQKTIQLSKSYGVDLGYSFSWYVKGPYSTSLTRDYYGLSRAGAVENLKLRDSAQKTIDILRENLFDSPKRPSELEKPDWLELLSSYDYLRNKRSLDETAIISKLETEKIHVAKYANNAKEALDECDKLLRETDT